MGRTYSVCRAYCAALVNWGRNRAGLSRNLGSEHFIFQVICFFCQLLLSIYYVSSKKFGASLYALKKWSRQGMKERPITRGHWTEFMLLLLNREYRQRGEPRSTRTGLIKGSQLHTCSPNSPCTPAHQIHIAHLIQLPLYTSSLNSPCMPDHWIHTILRTQEKEKKKTLLLLDF